MVTLIWTRIIVCIATKQPHHTHTIIILCDIEVLNVTDLSCDVGWKTEWINRYEITLDPGYENIYSVFSLMWFSRNHLFYGLGDNIALLVSSGPGLHVFTDFANELPTSLWISVFECTLVQFLRVTLKLSRASSTSHDTTVMRNVSTSPRRQCYLLQSSHFCTLFYIRPGRTMQTLEWPARQYYENIWNDCLGTPPWQTSSLRILSHPYIDQPGRLLFNTRKCSPLFYSSKATFRYFGDLAFLACHWPLWIREKPWNECEVAQRREKLVSCPFSLAQLVGECVTNLLQIPLAAVTASMFRDRACRICGNEERSSFNPDWSDYTFSCIISQLRSHFCVVFQKKGPGLHVLKAVFLLERWKPARQCRLIAHPSTKICPNLPFASSYLELQSHPPMFCEITSFRHETVKFHLVAGTTAWTAPIATDILNPWASTSHRRDLCHLSKEQRVMLHVQYC